MLTSPYLVGLFVHEKKKNIKFARYIVISTYQNRQK